MIKSKRNNVNVNAQRFHAIDIRNRTPKAASEPHRNQQQILEMQLITSEWLNQDYLT